MINYFLVLLFFKFNNAVLTTNWDLNEKAFLLDEYNRNTIYKFNYIFENVLPKNEPRK